MDQFTSKLYTEMNHAIQQHAIQTESILQKAQMSMQTAGVYLRQLKEFIVNYTFSDQQEEIRFFKTVKPIFLKEQIYYARIYQIEVERPVGSKDMLRAYFQKVLDSITAFYEHNRILFHYYRAGSTEYDHKIFIRDAENELFFPQYSLDVDSRFSTVCSQKIARIDAFEQVADYVLSQISALEHGPISGNGPDRHNLVWTDSIASLVELVYAVHASGSINHGRADMKDIVKALEALLNIRTGNFYQTIKNIRGRKKIRTPYLNNLIERAERRMDQTDMDF